MKKKKETGKLIKINYKNYKQISKTNTCMFPTSQNPKATDSDQTRRSQSIAIKKCYARTNGQFITTNE